MNLHLALNRKAGLKSIAKLPLLTGLSVERERERASTGETAVPEGMDRNAGNQGLFCHVWVEAKHPPGSKAIFKPRDPKAVLAEFTVLFSLPPNLNQVQSHGLKITPGKGRRENSGLVRVER